MTEFKSVISYVSQLPVDALPDRRAGAGSNFNAAAMCEYCRRAAAGEPVAVGNVVSIFSTCRRWNGCMVCGFCGVAIGGQAVSECLECGAVTFSAASQFKDDSDERVVQSRQLFAEWHRKMKCLDVFAVAAGMAVFMACEEDAPLAEDEVENLLDAALGATRLPHADECINRFFDRLQETLREAGQRAARTYAPLRLVTSSEPSAS